MANERYPSLMEPSSELINEDPEENRVLAAHMTGFYLSMYNASMEATVGVARWLLTSLLAINGAAAVATWQVDMQPTLKIAACGSFVAGILVAMLSGNLQVMGAPKLMEPIGKHIGYWVAVQSDGERVAALEDTADIQIAAKKAAFWPRVLGWASAALFTVGIAIAGYGALASLPRPLT